MNKRNTFLNYCKDIIIIKKKLLWSYELCIQHRKLAERGNSQDVLRNEKVMSQSSKKTKKQTNKQKRHNIFFIMKHRLLIAKELLFQIFWGWKIRSFWAKRLMEIWYLLITEKFLFWTFWGWEIRSFFGKNVDGKIIYNVYRKVLVLSFSIIGNSVFFKAKSWWKYDIYWVLKNSCFGQPKSSCFELCGDGKDGVFLVKKLM